MVGLAGCWWLAIGCTSSAGDAVPVSSTGSPAAAPTASVAASPRSPDGQNPSAVTGSTTSPANSSTGEPGATGSVEVIVRVATRAGGTASPAQLDETAAVLRTRAADIEGAGVTVRDGTIRLQAPGSDPDALNALAVVGRLDVRPVVGQPGSAKTWHGTAMPVGGDPQVPTQPAGTTTAGWQAWKTLVAKASTAGSAPSCEALGRWRGRDDPARPLLACNLAGDLGYLLDPAILGGDDIDTAEAALDPSSSQWSVTVELTASASTSWADYTRAHQQQLVAFTIDGQVLSAPIINAPITGGSTQISGGLDRTSATALADALRSGSLPLVIVGTSVHRHPR